MRASIVLASFCVACGGAATTPTVEPPARERVMLSFRAPRSVAVYDCQRSLTVRGERRRRPMALPARLVLRELDERPRRWLRLRTYGASGPSRRDRATRGLAVRVMLDGHGAFTEPPVVSGERSGMLGLGALVAERLLEPYLPGDAVAVGDTWEEPAYSFSPPTLSGQLAVERSFRLDAIDGEGHTRRAIVAWEGVVRLDHVSFQGMTVGGEVRASGVRSFRVDDPTYGYTTLDATARVSPTGIAGVLGSLNIEAKVRDSCVPDDSPGLIDGVRPVDPRRAI